MARPVDHEKRRTLAAQAVEVMLEEGLDVPMARLAERLGIKRPTLLYHFPDRASIALAALEEMFTTQVAYVVAEMSKHEHPLRQLNAQVRAVHKFHQGREDRVVLLSQTLAGSGRESAEQAIEIGNRAFEAERQAMVKRLKAAMKAGTMKKCDADALVRLVRSVNDGLMIQRVMTGAPLAPVHDFLWENVLKPLEVGAEKATPRSRRRKSA